ncbi:GH92 family glycosyl hydrolase [Marinoscillum furvescens]|uniref:Putative alpha-1,2-mannosidase n=1 Tax=Marinoscillum furvescens DSM 4134 TaxID=1122208 RepID=A0A3D9KXD4_MARFU|nr:GH92 family glycosyl hydrolase [Marinoscillum furvescens]RED93600.1 putative alpha-1,2-mannosidase [Marinoscillum furvescens DSM 4134]
MNNFFQAVRRTSWGAFAFLIVACSAPQENISSQNQQKVNPFIGTGGHGHTFPGATTPFGMIQLSPDNGTEGWDWCSGYHYSDSLIAGFSHTHLSGTGIGDLCDISLMPYLSADAKKGGRVAFSHSNEAAKPGNYQVKLANGIEVELTASERVGYHRYNFPAGADRALSIDLGFSINWDIATKTNIQKSDANLVTGYRYSHGWSRNQRVYFAAEFSENIQSMEISDGEEWEKIEALETDSLRAIVDFGKGGELLVKVAISSVSEENALANLKADKFEWDFDAVVEAADQSWQTELLTLDVEFGDPNLDTIFYSALYHTMMAPQLFSDTNGQFRGVNKEIYDKPHSRYTVFSLWDTFRAAHPLYTLTQPDQLNDMLLSLLDFYEEHGLLPVWALHGSETNTMTGYHAVPVLADALQKGYLKGQEEKVLEAMLASAQQDIRGTKEYREYGYVPADLDGWSVTKTLEYAYDDWCIAQVAKTLGKDSIADVFEARAQSYRALFDEESLFMRGKLADGSWLTPFDPFYSEHGFEGAYIEGTAWQHSWFVPHDVAGFISLFDSPDQFVNHLDSTFEVTSEMTGENVSADISGLIGQYAHGNEPSHHIAYLYSYAGYPWKTQERVRDIMRTMYHNDVDGYPGNEDCGQMSAWYVFSALGFYPVNPADGNYVLGSPLVDRAVLSLPDEKAFEIIARNNSNENVYVKEVKLNGKLLDRNFITHEEIMSGGTLEFVMDARPNTARGIQASAFPPSQSN